MSEENILFQYQVKSKTSMGIRYYYFYATTDIENYLNNKNIKYVRYAKDTALNKKEKRIRELFKENQQLKEMQCTYLGTGCKERRKLLESVLDEIREYINNYDVFKEFSFPLMKRDEENQVKSSIDYEFQTSIKKEFITNIR